MAPLGLGPGGVQLRFLRFFHGARARPAL
jgi:hypothetical protein